MTEHVNPEDLAKQISAEVKTTYDKLDKKTADLGEVLDALKQKLDAKADTTDLDGRVKDLNEEVKKLATVADDLDKKLSRPNAGGRDDMKSLGRRLIESDSFKSFVERGDAKFKFDVKAVLTADAATGTTQNYYGVTTQQAPLVRVPDRPLTIRDLMPVARTNSNAIEYPKETAFTNNAAPVAENTLKPESDVAFTMETDPIRTIAHWIQASKQILDDSTMLQSYIDDRLRYGLAIVEENQILLGDDTGQNLNGIIPQADAFPASVATSGIPGGTAATQVDVIRWAKLQARKSFYPATGVVLNPEDWAAIELLKDADGAYLYSAFASGTEPRLWGMRVVESDAITAGTFLVGSFALGAQLWDREQANVVISTEDRDNFVKNMITIRAEERVAVTVYRPDAFVSGSFTLAA